MSLAKKLSALVGVIAVGAGAAVAAHPAEAEGDSNIVLLGDSYMATQTSWLSSMITSKQQSPSLRGLLL